VGCRTGVGAGLSEGQIVSIFDLCERAALTIIGGMAVGIAWLLERGSDIVGARLLGVWQFVLRVDVFIVHSPL
jgi:hypothetical protein